MFGAFGNLNASKRVPQLLDAFARFREGHPDARLLLVGAAAPGVDLSGRIAQRGLEGDVVHEDYVDERRLWALMAASTSSSRSARRRWARPRAPSIRALSLGKPLLVSDVGWFSELPDDVALKVAPDVREVERLAAALEALARSGGARRHGRARRRARGASTTLEHVAELYAAALEEAAGGEVVRDAVLREVASRQPKSASSPRRARPASSAGALDEVEI